MNEYLNDFIEYERLKKYTRDTIRRKSQFIKSYISFIDNDYKNATRESVDEYITYLQCNNKSAEKINLHITYITQFFNYLIEREIITSNPASNIIKPSAKKTSQSIIFTKDEIKLLFNATQTYHKRKSLNVMIRDRAIIELFYSTGMRLSELIQLNINDIDFKRNEVNILNAKGSKQRVVPVGEKALYYIQQYINIRYTFIKLQKEYDSLFISRQGSRLAEVSVRKMIKRRKQEANIKTTGTTHIFRRTFASHMLTNGASLASIARLLGHELLQTTEKYTAIDINDLREKHSLYHPRS